MQTHFFLGILLFFSNSYWLNVAYSQETQSPPMVAEPVLENNPKTPTVEKSDQSAEKVIKQAVAEEEEENDEELDEVSLYKIVRPSWAIGARAGILRFPVSSALGSNYQLFWDYLLPWQRFGVVSAGVHLGVLPLNIPGSAVPYPDYTNASAGVSVRYQFHFLRNQFLVPTVAAEWDYYRLNPPNGAQGPITGSNFGLSWGAMLSLSFLDGVTSRDAFSTIGLTRCYLTLDIRSAKFENSTFTLKGNFWMSGIRLEFE